MKTKTRGALALTSLLLSAGTAAALEAKMYAVTTWNAGCGGSTRDSWDNMVEDWYNDITNSGWSFFGFCMSGHCSNAYSKDGKLVNGNMVNSHFADLSRVTWGNDHNHMDEGDAVMIGVHGADVNNGWSGSMRVDESGDGDCSARLAEMEIGDTDLEFLHLSSCNSMDDNMWSNWEKSMARAHQVDGFHGLMWIGSGLVDDYGDFSDDAFGGAISDAWLDNLHYNNEFNNGMDDQCPVAFAVGSTGADAINRLTNERYDHVFSDPPNSGTTGSGTIWATTYITGCNPAGEDTINN
ncbi:MAG TPA: DUF6345 domain-containing protein [Fibrobacteria bacterium]|nr:DUF6345 domain-containing protein [Fibrobacteria bacterium]